MPAVAIQPAFGGAPIELEFFSDQTVGFLGDWVYHHHHPPPPGGESASHHWNPTMTLTHEGRTLHPWCADAKLKLSELGGSDPIRLGVAWSPLWVPRATVSRAPDFHLDVSGMRDSPAPATRAAETARSAGGEESGAAASSSAQS